MLEQLKYTYTKLKNPYEIAIIEKYSYYGKCYTVALTGKPPNFIQSFTRIYYFLSKQTRNTQK